ncbi:hypothetical protein BGZ94_005721, partial [Podila epigama]
HPGCGKTFTRRTTLTRHQKGHEPDIKSFISENREQLAAAGVLDSLSFTPKMAILPKRRPNLQRSQSHSVPHSSPPSPGPQGNDVLPPVHDRVGTSPMNSRSIAPISTKHFGTSSPSSFYHDSSPTHSFSHSYSYQGEHGGVPHLQQQHQHQHQQQQHSGHGGSLHRAYSSEHQTHSRDAEYQQHHHHQHTQPLPHHQQQRSDPGHQHYHHNHDHQHEMSSSLPARFHVPQSPPSRPVRWEPNGNSHNSAGHGNHAPTIASHCPAQHKSSLRVTSTIGIITHRILAG